MLFALLTVSVDEPKANPSNIPPPLVVKRFSNGSLIFPGRTLVPKSLVPFHRSTMASPRNTMSKFLGAFLASLTKRA